MAEGWHVPTPGRYLPPGRPPEAPSGRAGVPVGLIVAVEAVAVAGVAFGGHLVWPVWGAVAVVAVWAVLLAAPLAARRAYGYREPAAAERVQVEQAWRNVQGRAGTAAYRLVVVESEALNACTPFGRTVAVTSHSARSLPPGTLEAVLAHELGHLLGWRAVPAFLHAQVTLPSRALTWVLRGTWAPVGPMWKRAVAWHRPIGFVAAFLLTVLATAVTVAVALPAAAAQAASRAARLPRGRAEARADAAAVRLGFGAELVAVVEHRIEHAPHGLPMPLVRRAQGLRRRLG
ncbi:M48 family metalloprotease [Actinomadura sp. 7K507]|uniref:M48 family metalloprotease n=1 Tax=Actinomadura sp. 7K507 TaxID=2530365 RepID=UPI001404DFF4|nr:M48 family metalloprotease [Actinomadura sp. 7K507]